MRYFSELYVGQQFNCNGNLYVKRSSKTAYLVEYKRTFYFRHYALCYPAFN